MNARLGSDGTGSAPPTAQVVKTILAEFPPGSAP